MTDAGDSAVTANVRRRVKELRQRKNWRVSDLADRCAQLGLEGLTVDVLTSLELGRRKNVTLDELVGLALALDVSPVHLMVGPDEKQWTVGKVTVPRPLPWLAGVWYEPAEAQSWLEAHPDQLMPMMFAIARERMVDLLSRELQSLLDTDDVLELYGKDLQSKSSTTKKGATRSGNRPKNP
jgi:transcriptional regulator with XRE-family HTH domain